MTGSYDDIIYLPHHISDTHAHMSMYDRAAQFSPFAALTGYNSAVKETARLTDQRIELDESEKALLNERLQFVAENISNQPQITIVYFLPDRKKDGGAYVETIGVVKKIDSFELMVTMMDRSRIPIREIVAIDGDIFDR